MSTKHRWIAMLLALSVVTACASTAPMGARSMTPVSAAAPVPHAYVTGSHIALPVDPRTGLPQTASPTQTVTRDDLNRTGQIDVGSALRQLVPELH